MLRSQTIPWSGVLRSSRTATDASETRAGCEKAENAYWAEYPEVGNTARQIARRFYCLPDTVDQREPKVK